MLTITLGLGFWQIQRLAWKQSLLAAIEHGEVSPAIPLVSVPTPFLRVIATGRFLPGEARYGIELRSVGRSGPVMGSHVLNALKLTTGDPLIVDRGWAPLDLNVSPPAGEVQIEGYVRPPDRPVWFGPRDDLVARRFYTLAPSAVGASLGIPSSAPFTLVALGVQSDTLPQPAVTLPRPPNDHFLYAVTWFGLSAVLLVIFAFYIRQLMRHGPGT